MEAEERGQGEAIARNLFEMSDMKVPILAIITGQGGSGGALALAVSNEVWMMENATYSILSPEGFASILWKDGSRAKEAAEVMKLTAHDLMDKGILDAVIEEPLGGAQNDIEAVCERLRAYIHASLEELQKAKMPALLAQRYEKYRNIGVI